MSCAEASITNEGKGRRRSSVVLGKGDVPLVRRLFGLATGDGRRLAVGAPWRSVSGRSPLSAVVESGATVHSWELSRVGVAVGESRSVVARRVPHGAFGVVDVRAVLCGVGPARVAGADGELGGRHEVVPLLELHPLALLSGNGTREDESTGRVTRTGRSVRVELSTVISLPDVHTSEITETGDLNEVWCLNKVSLLEGSFGDQTGTVARFGTVSNHTSSKCARRSVSS